ncbi:methylation-associated defense system DNA methyltransferase MAD2 [Haloactinomyces albus]|nr:N-6 DNA methylase [Haloactinomyces albus]
MLDALAEDEIVDYITGEAVKETPKEKVRQRIVRGLLHEYGIAVEYMASDFPVTVDNGGGRKRTKKADIAIFDSEEHTQDNLRRVVVCKPEPKNGNTVTKIRTHEQATKELDELKELMGNENVPELKYGLWTNGVDLFYLHKEIGRWGTTYEPRADWPQSSESLGSRSVASHARLRSGEEDMLRTAFRRCHNYIHGNEGLPKDAAFWQFMYLLYAKIHDEQVNRNGGAQFYAAFDEPFTDDGRGKIRERIDNLFAQVKNAYPLFSARDEITLSDRALAFIVGQLAPYNLADTEIDAKGAAYQELVGNNLRGDRGQYFTPVRAVRLMVDILAPQEHERVLDPACGTGGFLRETLAALLKQWRENEGIGDELDAEEQRERHRQRLKRYVENNLFGADFDPFLVRATSLNLMTVAGTQGNVYHMNSLAFPDGTLPGVEPARAEIRFGSVDVLMTNPPFGSDIKITDEDVLNRYRDGVAQSWTRSKETGLPVASSTPVTGVSPEQLFIQRAVQWVKPGGRIGIVLPNGILSNPGPSDEAIRRWILENCWVLASVELPVEAFIYEAGVNILTTLLFLKKKTDEERMAKDMGADQEYPVFMAIAEKVGVDRRGNPVYKRHPDGEIVLDYETKLETFRIGGQKRERTLHRTVKVIDDDLPEIGRQYHQFRVAHPEPGFTPEGTR